MNNITYCSHCSNVQFAAAKQVVLLAVIGQVQGTALQVLCPSTCYVDLDGSQHMGSHQAQANNGNSLEPQSFLDEIRQRCAWLLEHSISTAAHTIVRKSLDTEQCSFIVTFLRMSGGALRHA